MWFKAILGQKVANLGNFSHLYFELLLVHGDAFLSAPLKKQLPIMVFYGFLLCFFFTVDPLWFSHQVTFYGLIKGAQEVFRSLSNLKRHLEPTIPTKGRAK